MTEFYWKEELEIGNKTSLLLDALEAPLTVPKRVIRRIQVVQVPDVSRHGAEALQYQCADYVIPGLPDVHNGRYRAYKLYTSDSVLSAEDLTTVAIVGSPVSRSVVIVFADLLRGYIKPRCCLDQESIAMAAHIVHTCLSGN